VTAATNLLDGTTTPRTQSAIEQATATLVSALGTLVTISEASDAAQQAAAAAAAQAKAALGDIVTRYGQLVRTDYTAVSWGPFKVALDAATLQVSNANATTAQLSQALHNLVNAAAGLVTSATAAEDAAQVAAAKAALGAMYNQYSALDSDPYTAESWASLATALTAAQAAMDDPASTTPQLQAAIHALAQAAGALEFDTAAADEAATQAAERAKAEVEARAAEDLRSARAQAEAEAAAAAARAEAAARAAAEQAAQGAALAGQIEATRAAIQAVAQQYAGLKQADFDPAAWAPFATAMAQATATAANPGAGIVHLQGALATLVQAASTLMGSAIGTLGAPDVPAVARVKVAQSTVRLAAGRSLTLAAAAYSADGTAVGAVTFASSKPSVARVNAQGKVTARKAGTSTITIKAGGKTAKVKVTVVARRSAAKVTTVAVRSLPTAMAVGQVAYPSVTWRSASATGVKVTYKSSKPAVVQVDRSGRLVAKAPGTATVTVKAGAKSTKVKVTVQ
jgi:uncharacterized protein YjdB